MSGRFRPGKYVELRDDAVRALRKAVDAYADEDSIALASAIAEGVHILIDLEPYGEVFVEPSVQPAVRVLS